MTEAEIYQKQVETCKQVQNMINELYISKDKIRDILLKFQNEYGEDLETTDRLFIGKEVVQYGEDMIDEIAKELDIKLLEENYKMTEEEKKAIEYFKDNYIRRSKIEEAIRFNEECLRKGKGPDKFTLQYCIIELRRLLEKDSIIIEGKE